MRSKYCCICRERIKRSFSKGREWRKIKVFDPCYNQSWTRPKGTCNWLIADRTQGHKLFSAKTTPVTTGRQGRRLSSSELSICCKVFFLLQYLSSFSFKWERRSGEKDKTVWKVGTKRPNNEIQITTYSRFCFYTTVWKPKNTVFPVGNDC